MNEHTVYNFIPFLSVLLMFCSCLRHAAPSGVGCCCIIHRVNSSVFVEAHVFPPSVSRAFGKDYVRLAGRVILSIFSFDL